MKMTVRLKTIEDVIDFVNMCSKCKCDVFATQGEYRINAKSILGIYSLNLLEKFDVMTSTEEELYSNIEKWKYVND